MKDKSEHWADETAAKIVREKGEKASYTCASGITPSGTVHIGNFREIISVDLVVRALRDRGKTVRFIYSWDDYDVFRKVPRNMPGQEELKACLRLPITMVPDPWGREESYARHHERAVETALPVVGIRPEYIYQSRRYRESVYAAGIRRALEAREALKTILDRFRDEEHKIQGEWWPISVFCGQCKRDTTEVEGWDREWGVSYRCASCGCAETVDLRAAPGVKLGWRVDWPMRWEYEKVDFEPAGKDHHSSGGSFDTARQVCKEVYRWDAPVTFKYDFIGIKGSVGKISSSSGIVVDLNDLLKVYTPELVRYLFAGTRPDTEFTVSFDLDVIKLYEDYDRLERIAFGNEPAKDGRAFAKARRTYELSQVAGVPGAMPYQVPFRHLCNLIQIADRDIEKTLDGLPRLAPAEREALRARCVRAAYWIEHCAPEDFRFSLRAEGERASLSDAEAGAVRDVRDRIVARIGSYPDDRSCAEALYKVAEAHGLEGKDLFRAAYQALIAKDQGPRLANFLRSISPERLMGILRPY
jgi:lysyl-tRNA synthetase class 1